MNRDDSILANLDDNYGMPKRYRSVREKQIKVTSVRMLAVVIGRSYHLLTEDEASDLKRELEDSGVTSYKTDGYGGYVR